MELYDPVDFPVPLHVREVHRDDEGNPFRTDASELAAGSEAERRLQEATRLLDRIERWDPEVRRGFELKRRTESKARFRLLLNDASFNSAKHRSIPISYNESYIAVSYCWQYTTWTPTYGHAQYVDSAGCHWPTSKLMLRAVLALRQSETEGIWIDAVCIDQRNDIEKVHAVSLMDRVYHRARLVVVLLEDAWVSEPEAAALEKFECLVIYPRSCAEKQRTPLEIQRAHRAAARLATSRWFGRAWCAQEYHLGERVQFIVPRGKDNQPHRFQAKTLISLLGEVEKTSHALMNKSLTSSAPLNRQSNNILRVPRISRTALSTGFYNTLAILEDLEASEIGDKISIALNIVGLPLIWCRRVRNRDVCRWILATLAFMLTRFDAITAVGVPLGIPSHENWSCSRYFRREAAFEGYSWLHWPDNSRPRGSDGPMFQCLPKHFQYATPQCLRLRILRIRTQDPKPSSQSRFRASDFVRERVLSNADMLIKHSTAWATFFSHLRSSTLSRLQLVQWLSCALECGEEWMGHVGKSMRARSPDISGLVKPYSEETQWWLSNLVHLIPTRYNEGCAETLQECVVHYLQLTFAQNMTSYGQDRGSYHLVQLGPLDNLTMIQSPYPLSSVYAVPARFASAEFDGSRRLWRLHEVDPVPSQAQEKCGKRYTISDKIELFSLHAISGQHASGVSDSLRVTENNSSTSSTSSQSKAPEVTDSDVIELVGLELQSTPGLSSDSKEGNLAFYKGV